MIARFAVVFIGVVVSLSAAPLKGQQEVRLLVHRSANLRASATTQSAVKAKLEPGQELTQISPGKLQGFHHVRTIDGTEGWVYQTLVHVIEDDEVPTHSFSGAATSFDPAWPKPNPVGSIFRGPPGFDPCPADGEAGGDVETNRRKNRKDVPASYQAVTWRALRDLPYPTDAPNSRKNWTSAQKAKIEPFEGVAVSVIGYIVAVKKQYGGSGEATNCHFNTATFVDAHVALVENVGDGEKESVVVEPTPRFYAQNPRWVWAKLNDLDDSPDPVRISGWTLLDPNHKNHLGTYRSTLWEIHPITKIEVFTNSQWVKW